MSQQDQTPLAIGYWYLTRREQLLKWLTRFLVAVNVVIWGLFFVRGISYVAGSARHAALLQELNQPLVNASLYHQLQVTAPSILGLSVYPLGTQRYDIAAKLANPNLRYAVYFTYQFFDEGQTCVLQVCRTSF